MKWIVSVIVLLSGISVFALFEQQSNCLSLTFLDVGQGDSILVSAPNGNQILIDAGRGNRILSGLRAYMPRGDKTIESIIITHADADHADGFASVLKEYDVKTALFAREEKDDDSLLSIMKVLNDKGASLLRAEAGTTIDLGFGSGFTVIYPPANISPTFTTNASSVVGVVSTAKTQALLTGDAPQSVELFLVETYGNLLKSEYLKLGHHGSRTSSAEDFVKSVGPRVAIVSAGKNNSYGHPNTEVVERAKQFGAIIADTAESGELSYCLSLK